MNFKLVHAGMLAAVIFTGCSEAFALNWPRSPLWEGQSTTSPEPVGHHHKALEYTWGKFLPLLKLAEKRARKYSSGAAVQHGKSVSQVAGTFVVPTLTFPDTMPGEPHPSFLFNSSVWVGMGGFERNHTDKGLNDSSGCGGKLKAGVKWHGAWGKDPAGWTAWYSWFPEDRHIDIPILQVMPSQHVSIDIVANSNMSATFTFTVDNGKPFTKTLQSDRRPLCLRKAEWAVEYADMHNVPIPDFETVKFTNASWTNDGELSGTLGAKCRNMKDHQHNSWSHCDLTKDHVVNIIYNNGTPEAKDGGGKKGEKGIQLPPQKKLQSSLSEIGLGPGPQTHDGTAMTTMMSLTGLETGMPQSSTSSESTSSAVVTVTSTASSDGQGPTGSLTAAGVTNTAT